LQVVAGLSLRNLQPPVWDPQSSYYLEGLSAVMVSYAEFPLRTVLPRRSASGAPTEPQTVDSQKRKQAMDAGLRALLGIPEEMRIYLDNGAFHFSAKGITTDVLQYQRFVEAADPDWKPVAQDFIPLPSMTAEEQQQCLTRTMSVNRSHQHDGYAPVIHISTLLEQYLEELTSDVNFAAKRDVAVGGLVPNLLRAPKAMAYDLILRGLMRTRHALAEKQLHVFGVGGTATLHLAALLGINSVDSCGWRNRAARGIVQLPGSGDRSAIKMGSWRGREPNKEEWELLDGCVCPPCQHGADGLKADGLHGFCHRATHNLWVLLREATWIQEQFAAGTYEANFGERLDNSIYLPLIEQVAERVGVPSVVTSSNQQLQTDAGTGGK
jgi:7-cyano-7-deazaguanine tRNA-ribosyltransferase